MLSRPMFNSSDISLMFVALSIQLTFFIVKFSSCITISGLESKTSCTSSELFLLHKPNNIPFLFKESAMFWISLNILPFFVSLDISI